MSASPTVSPTSVPASIHYKLREAPFAGAVVVIAIISIVALLVVLIPSQTHKRAPHKSIPASWEQSFEKIESASAKRNVAGGMASKEGE